MKFNKERYNEIIETFIKMLEILKSSSYTSSVANLFLKNFKEPDFSSEFWIQFNTKFKKLLDLATKYTALSNEDPNSQLEVKRMLAVIRMVDIFTLVKYFKEEYNEENETNLAKKKLEVFINQYVKNLPTNLEYAPEKSNDYDISFKLKSKDGKKVLSFETIINNKNEITVFGSAIYTDHDFEFSIEEIKFDPLLFKDLESCVTEIMAKLDLRVAMKISGTRIRIANYIFVLSSKDLAMAKADLLKEGKTSIYAITGERINLTTGQEGRLLDSMNTNLFGVGKLYFNVGEKEQDKQEKVITNTNKKEEDKNTKNVKQEQKNKQETKESANNQKKESKPAAQPKAETKTTTKSETPNPNLNPNPNPKKAEDKAKEETKTTKAEDKPQTEKKEKPKKLYDPNIKKLF